MWRLSVQRGESIELTTDEFAEILQLLFTSTDPNIQRLLSVHQVGISSESCSGNSTLWVHTGLGSFTLTITKDGRQ